jgi:hypothetical protein
MWGSSPDIYYALTVTVFLWDALSDERMGLTFLYAAGPHQRILSRVWVPSDSWPSFTFSDLRLLFSSPPMSRRVTVEVFQRASTRMMNCSSLQVSLYSLALIHRKWLLLVGIHGKCLLFLLTWKERSITSRSLRIRISTERVLDNRCLAMNYSVFQASYHITLSIRGRACWSL